MTVKELIEILQQLDPEKEVVIFAPDRDYYSYGCQEYSLDKADINDEPEMFSICVDY